MNLCWKSYFFGLLTAAAFATAIWYAWTTGISDGLGMVMQSPK